MMKKILPLFALIFAPSICLAQEELTRFEPLYYCKIDNVSKIEGIQLKFDPTLIFFGDDVVYCWHRGTPERMNKYIIAKEKETYYETPIVSIPDQPGIKPVGWGIEITTDYNRYNTKDKSVFSTNSFGFGGEKIILFKSLNYIVISDVLYILNDSLVVNTGNIKIVQSPTR